MDRRGWPWKKKSSDKDKDKDKAAEKAVADKAAEKAVADKAAEKAVADKAAEKAVTDKAAEKAVVAPDAAAGSLASAGSQGNQDKSKKANYVQISVEAYAHLTEMEEEVKTLSDQVSTLHDEVNILNEKLSSAQSEMTTKENVVKQHAKVAEEAVSGWEKAEAEALALKQQLESVTLLKLTAEDRSSHLDGALKECMRQIRNVKDEHEKKLHEIVQTKTKQWDKIKLELEAKLVDFDQQLLRSSAENAAISRSLQERSNMLMKISEEKSHAEADIEHLKANIESCEREIGSLKYELHISSKELEIRNEERNMSMRSAEVANKQHLEGVKKITKLESECQRLRSLVRKKLPGPAALAQMKLEVENLGRDYVETRSRRSPGLSPTPSLAPVPEISLDNVQQCHKETEFLTSRMLAMEEETKMLKEALAKRNSELQSSRNVCAKTTSKLRGLEAQIQVLYQQKNASKSNAEVPTEGSSSQNASNPPSLTSMSEDGVDEEGSVAESWATQLISELSHFKKERNVDRANKTENANNMELMDDFLEMERLACLPTESNRDTSGSGSVTNKGAEKDDQHVLPKDAKSENLRSDDPVSSKENLSAGTLESNTNEVSLSRLQSRISMIFESVAKDSDLGRVLEDIKQAVQDIQHALPQDSVTCILGEQLSVDVTGNQQSLAQDSRETAESGNLLTQDSEPKTDAEHIIDQDLAIAVSQIHDFVVSVGKEATAIRGIHPNEDELSTKVEEFASSVNKVLCYEMSLANLVLDLSHVLAKISELNISMPGYKGNEGETNSSDCIDKVTLLEKKVVQDDSMREKLPNGCAHISLSASDTEALREGRSSPGIQLKVPSCKCSLEELEQVKLEKDSLAMDLVRCTDDLEHSKSQLLATEHLLTELKSQLASCQNSNSLAETQLKCMVESYKLLEKRTQELEAEVSVLHAKNDALNSELQEEKQNHQDALAKCISLQEEIQRNEPCPTCSLSAAAETEKSKQEKEIAAAAEKLAECQETIFLLGRQLKALRPSSEQTGSPYNERHQTTEGFVEDEPSPRSLDPNSLFSSQDFDNTELETTSSSYMGRAAPGSPSPSDMYNVPSSPSQTETNHYSRSPINSKRPKHRSTKSSSSSSSGPTPEKHSRGFSRFFSSKAKSAQ